MRQSLQVGQISAILLAILLMPRSLAAAAPRDLETPALEHIRTLPPSRVKTMLEMALGRLGTPYRWGGDDFAVDDGVDCVGLVYWLYHLTGLEFPLARFSSLNMTSKERGPHIPKVWWTDYVKDFEQDMVACTPPLADGDVIVYHDLKDSRIDDRTGHVVIAVDAKKGLAISAATGGVRLHSLGDYSRYGTRERTGCWRAPSAVKEPVARPELTWHIELSKGKGTKAAPYRLPNPVTLNFSVKGKIPSDAKLVALGRVNSFIGAVTPKIEAVPVVDGVRRYGLSHDFKSVDLPVDPGETIKTPLRKIVLRFLGPGTMIVGEKSFYVQLEPYW